MKELFFDYHNQPVTVSDEIYNKIVSIVNVAKICTRCEEGYTEKNPCVTLNTCLGCFLQKDIYKNLTFIGEMKRNTETDSKYFRFITKKGKVFVSSTFSQGAEKSETATLNYWGFSYPLYYSYDGEEHRLYDTYWTICGNIKTNTVLLIESMFTYWSNHQSKTKYVTYFAFKNGGYIEVNKRKKAVKQLFTKAQELLEATKDSKGYYHYNDSETTWLSDYLIKQAVSDIASKEDYTG